jgi:dienelactone hydrolase
MNEKGLSERPVLRSFSLWLSKLVMGMVLLGTAQASEQVSFEATRSQSADKVTLRAELSRPEGQGPFPAVVLMHGCGGWQPAVRYTMSRYAAHLVGNGFVVLSVDSFGPRHRGGGKVCESFDQLAQARDYRTYDAHDALRYLQSQSYVEGGNVFLMGQSNGGSVAIKVAQGDGPHDQPNGTDGYRGVVAFYPWCGAFNGRTVQLKTPLLVFGGGQDDWVPISECKDVRSTGAEMQLIVYPNAAHSFDLDISLQRYLGKLVGRDAQAANDSRDRMLTFFITTRHQPAGDRTLVAQSN